VKEFFKIALVIVLIPLAGVDLGLGLAYFFGSCGIKYSTQQRATHSYSNQDHAASEPPNMAARISSATKTQPDANTTNTKDPTIDQTGDSVWVILQGLSAPVAAFFAFVLLWVGYGQLKAIHRQADIAEKTVIPAERAYMFVQRIDATVSPVTGGYVTWTFDVIWQNVGKTPTRNLRIYTQTFVDPLDIPANFQFLAAGEFPITIAGPGGVVQGLPVGISPADLAASQAGESFIYIWGWARYLDVFEHTPEHVTKFCWRLQMFGDPTKMHHPETNFTQFRWRHHVRHNCADEDCAK
jgi:hypothetical protein